LGEDISDEDEVVKVEFQQPAAKEPENAEPCISTSALRSLTWQQFDWLMSGLEIEQPKAFHMDGNVDNIPA